MLPHPILWTDTRSFKAFAAWSFEDTSRWCDNSGLESCPTRCRHGHQRMRGAIDLRGTEWWRRVLVWQDWSLTFIFHIHHFHISYFIFIISSSSSINGMILIVGAIRLLDSWSVEFLSPPSAVIVDDIVCIPAASSSSSHHSHHRHHHP